jgi:hypothetical protein
MPNRPSSPRDPLRRGGAAGLVDLWTTQRSVAQSSTTPRAAANGSGQMMCYQNRTSPSAIDIPLPTVTVPLPVPHGTAREEAVHSGLK